MDAVGSNIRVDARGREVMRILPRTHEDVNEEWISDKTRFVWDGLKSQRLDRPYVREFGKLRAATWQEAFLRIAQRLKGAKPDRIGIILGDLVGAEEAFSVRQLADQLGIKNIDCRQDGSPLGEPRRPCGLSLQHRHRRHRRGGLDPAHRHQSAPRGAGAERAHPQARCARGGCTIMRDRRARRPHLSLHLSGDGPRSAGPVSGFRRQAAGAKPDGDRRAGRSRARRWPAGSGCCLQGAEKLGAVKDGWNGFNVLHTAAGRVGALDVCALPCKDGGKTTREMLDAAKSG